MDPILIPTFPQLESTVQPRHLLLSHLLDFDRTAFYRRRAELGDYLILDNSAHERSEGENLVRLLEQAKQLCASEIVLPDKLFDKTRTVYNARSSLSSIERMIFLGQVKSIPRLMIVPQGATPKELDECLWDIVGFIVDLMMRSKAPEKYRFVIGVSKDYNTYWSNQPNFLIDFFRKSVFPASREIGADIHLLGWPLPLKSLSEIAYRYGPLIRSTDSARPYTFALAGIDLSQSLDVKYPKRPRDFFCRDIPEENLEILRRNIHVYRNLCRGFLHD